MSNSSTHDLLMQRCLDLASIPSGMVSPNPYVGALLVNERGDIVAEGYHRGPGLPHAERECLAQFFEKFPQGRLEGLTLYCNLEPCCHLNKRTPPCAQFLIESGIKRVFIGQLDPNPEVNGKGVELLRKNGIEVSYGILEKESKRLNRIFNHQMESDRPYICLKWAQSLDGASALANGHSQWITGVDARRDSKLKRFMHDATGVGLQTVLADNPFLNQFDEERELKKKSYKVIFSSKKEPILIPKDFHIFEEGDIFIVSFENKEELLEELRKLKNKHGLNSLFIEGGSKTLSLFIEAGLFEECYIYIAPLLLGTGKKVEFTKPLEDLSLGCSFKESHFSLLGEQCLFHGIKETSCKKGRH
jgi:diaminohydroxyphosphoribosylaminopyrimidine deaminase / 5-amino-6-(5-phosphoribosylamino)uracil reductase